MSPCGPSLVSGRFCRQAAPGLGPPRPAQHEESGDCLFARTVRVATVSAATAHPTGWRGGFPTGRPWDFALTTLRSPREPFASSRCAVAHRIEAPFLTLPDPVPRIARASHLVTKALSHGMGPTRRLSGDSLPAGLRATGGDSNPACHCGRFHSPVSSGWPHARFDLSIIGAWHLRAVAGRRPPPCPLSPCFARLNCCVKVGLRVRSLFLFRRPVSRPTTRGRISRSSKITKLFHLAAIQLSTALRNPQSHRNLPGEQPGG